MSRAYPPVTFDLPTLAEGYGGATWFRVFRCPACGTTLGHQRIGVVYGAKPDERGLRPTDHTIERVELAHGFVPLDPDEEGLLRFGLPKRHYMKAPRPPEAKRRSGLRRSTSVLPSVETTDQFNIVRRGDPYHVARHDPRRARSADTEEVLALSGEQARQPFVVTCLNLRCQRHWLVAGLPSAAELAAAWRGPDR